MKMTAIAKASLALSILATGVITSTAQTVDASEHESKYENVTKDIFDLRDYYSGASKELKMLLAIVIAKVASTTLSLIKIESSQEYKFFGKDIERIKARKNPGLDIFVVKEGKIATAQCIHMVVLLRKIKVLIMIT